MAENLYRLLPSVDQILASLESEQWFSTMPRPLVRDQVNQYLDRLREEIRKSDITDQEELTWERLENPLRAFVISGARPNFRRVLNGTGVVIHTNLGRSILAKEAAKAVSEACAHYSNLEFNLETGERGSRYSHVEGLLCRLTGAEAALVVNNNAGAVFLILDAMAKGKEVLVSRGQLVEIGGSFRIPDVMAKSGAKLVEVGTTNRTHSRDYENAITSETAALMKVHASNFRITGFTSEVSLKELVDLGSKYGLPVIEDLGSGNFYNFAALGLAYEPTVQETVEAGADVISFSGDKVLGGPQAGIIVGKKIYIDRIKANPLNRAVRIDKMTLAALEATLRLYLDPDQAREKIPTLAMISARPKELKKRAERLRQRLKRHLGAHLKVKLLPGVSRAGGGSFPERDLETTLVALTPSSGTSVDDLKKTLLTTDPPLVGRIEEDVFCLDPRTLTDEEFPLVVSVLAQALKNEKK
ncbi:MAG: L-seryl-tRNA(Sec) selenium transferase [Thermodesulfobacteriota bacterium]|nr:L-seryl-tRNA(Sec) selenium transferase [Thermodesulfobacteriota bacterium]